MTRARSAGISSDSRRSALVAAPSGKDIPLDIPLTAARRLLRHVRQPSLGAGRADEYYCSLFSVVCPSRHYKKTVRWHYFGICLKGVIDMGYTHEIHTQSRSMVVYIDRGLSCVYLGIYFTLPPLPRQPCRFRRSPAAKVGLGSSPPRQGTQPPPRCRGLHSFTLELNLSNSRTHS